MGEGVSPKFRIIRRGLDKIMAPNQRRLTDEIMRHGVSRLVYGVPIATGNNLLMYYNKKLVKDPPPDTDALVRLGAFLKQRGAQVEMIYLPAGPGGAQIGLDDFYAVGHTPDDLWQYATSEVRSPPHDPAADTGPYIVQDNRIVFMRRVGNDAKEPMMLTNFLATIREEVIADDGASERGGGTQERRNVLEQDAGLGEIRYIADIVA